jgi:hypothetical protein
MHESFSDSFGFTWVARQHIFTPNILVYFGGPWNGKCSYILGPFGIFYGREGYFMTIGYTYFVAIWYIFPVLVSKVYFHTCI